MENPTKAITATLTIITAIAATSMIESRLAIRKFLQQPSGGIDLRQTSEFPREPSDPKAAGRIRTIDAGSIHRAFAAAQNCSVIAVVSSVTFQPFVSAFSLANLCSF